MLAWQEREGGVNCLHGGSGCGRGDGSKGSGVCAAEGHILGAWGACVDRKHFFSCIEVDEEFKTNKDYSCKWRQILCVSVCRKFINHSGLKCCSSV